jgi:hypothetical protein
MVDAHVRGDSIPQAFVTRHRITVPPLSSGALSATVLAFNCQTGQIQLGYLGGNESPVEFKAVGITNWSASPTFTLDECGRTCQDTPPFVIQVRQNGVKGTPYTWSRQLYCAGLTNTQPPSSTSNTGTTSPVSATAVETPQPLTILASFYNCRTRELTFKTTGGNGSATKFFAIGITSWTTQATNTGYLRHLR